MYVLHIKFIESITVFENPHDSNIQMTQLASDSKPYLQNL